MVSPDVHIIKPNQVCKLVKFLYGLKQASRWWHERFINFLIKHHYKQARAYYSLFVKSYSSSFTILLVYVDNVILASNDLNEVKSIKEVFHNFFKIKDLRKLKYLISIEVTHSNDGISQSQIKYCLNLQKDSDFTGSKPLSTSSDPIIKLHWDSNDHYPDISTYIRFIGRLLYLNATIESILICFYYHSLQCNMQSL